MECGGGVSQSINIEVNNYGYVDMGIGHYEGTGDVSIMYTTIESI